MRSFYLVAIFEVIEEEVGVGDGEDEVLHLLPQHVQVLPVLHIPGWRIGFILIKCLGFHHLIIFKYSGLKSVAFFKISEVS